MSAEQVNSDLGADAVGPVGVLTEVGAGERRVALDPEAANKLVKAGRAVLVEHEAGARAWFADTAYAEAGAELLDRDAVIERARVLLAVGCPPPEVIVAMRSGQWLIGLLAPLTNQNAMRTLAAKGVTTVSLDGLPRTLSRAQGMDALSSQANVAGYRAVIVAATHFRRFFPLLITAAGTAKPANVLVLGAGVAGLQAIGTARRLGAQVTGYDVRPAARDEVRSLGAKFLELSTAITAAGVGGYARELTAEERAAQQAELASQIGRQDVVITTAQVPGRTPPLLVTADALAGMRPGSVVVDMGASELGGNVAGSQPAETVVTSNGVTVVGAGNLASEMATSASQAYARNVTALLNHLSADGIGLQVDLDDEISRGVLVSHEGQVLNSTIAAAMGANP